LILSPGAGAIVPPLTGVNSENIFVVKTVPDSDKLKKYIADNKPQKAVIIGG
jgi:NADPH-dependent 2,4-dienoyl-CoA reductase/sulfur reductase-like enzyme